MPETKPCALDLLHAESVAFAEAVARGERRQLRLQQLKTAAALRLEAAALDFEAARIRADNHRRATRPFPHLRLA
jgi:hypothetical protein